MKRDGIGRPEAQGRGETKCELLRRLRLGDLRGLFRRRYHGMVTLPDDDAGRADLDDLLIVISLGPKPRERMRHAIGVVAPFMDEVEAEMLIARHLSVHYRTRAKIAAMMGERQGVTNAQRDAFRLWTMRPCDIDRETFDEARRRKQRDRKRVARRGRGVRPRKAYLASAATRSPGRNPGRPRASAGGRGNAAADSVTQGLSR